MIKTFLSLLFLFTACQSEGEVNLNYISLVKKYYQAVNEGDTLTAAGLVSKEFTKINNDITSHDTGPDLVTRSIEEHLSNNSEYRFIVDDIFCSGNKVAVRWRWESINIKTGQPKKINSQGISLFEIKEGRINRLWQAFDILGFNKQLNSN